MNKPRANRDEIRSNGFNIPMSKAEKERIRVEADKRGVSMSELGRTILNDFFKKEEFKK